MVGRRPAPGRTKTYLGDGAVPVCDSNLTLYYSLQKQTRDSVMPMSRRFSGQVVPAHACVKCAERPAQCCVCQRMSDGVQASTETT